MNASDRIALTLGRAILRGEQLADDLAVANQRITQLEAEKAALEQSKRDEPAPPTD